ncbi:MAG: tetratricopeptide repeat protein [Bacteroidales bacterium]|nr:tetratricopeptide repeat protein [Bacteroidales bacterium]
MSGNSINRRKITKNDKLRNNNEKLRDKSNKLRNKNEELRVIKDKLNTKDLLVYVAVLVVVTFGVFFITFQNDYTNWDDGKYVEENPLIKPFDGKTISEIFTSDNLSHRYWMGNYHPLTMLSLNINYAFAKKDAEGIPDPFGFQLVNILLHIINTLLVFFILFKLLKDKNIAFFAALLFGVHTLHVESVSWIAERKDVLYTAFFLASLYLYTIYVETKKTGAYIFAFLLFIFSLLSKGQATSLAITIFLIDYFYDRKILSVKVIAEKIPFLIVALIFGLIAIEAQKQGNALQVVNTTPIPSRVGIAGYGFTMYILKLILPINLSAIYPYPDILNQTIPAYFWLGLITVAGVGFAAFKTFKTNKIIFFGIGFFAVNIFLLLQLLPVGSAIYSDRYAYIPSIGFYLIVAYAVSKLKIKDIKAKYALIIVYAILLSILTINRIQVWQNSRSLWEDVIAKQPKSVIAWNNLGSVYNLVSKNSKNELDYQNYETYKLKAIDCFDKAIARKPDYTSAFYNRGFSKRDLGIFKNDTTMVLEAIEDFNSSIATDLTFMLSYIERGAAYDWLGDFERALNDYNTVLNYEPKNNEVIINRGITKGKTGDYNGAIEDFNLALSINPDFATAYSNRGLAYAFLRDYDNAIADYTTAINLESDGNTYFNRGLAYFNLNENEKAIADFNEALNAHFDQPDLYYYKGMTEKRLGNKEQACADILIAAEKGYPYAIAEYQKNCQ